MRLLQQSWYRLHKQMLTHAAVWVSKIIYFSLAATDLGRFKLNQNNPTVNNNSLLRLVY